LKNCTRTWAQILWLQQKKMQVLLHEFQWIHCIRWNF
jgi:hypothetical protein